MKKNRALRLLAVVMVAVLVFTAIDFTVPVMAADGQEESLSEELQALQTRIDALPTPEEYSAKDDDGKQIVTREARSIFVLYYALSEADQNKIDIAKLKALYGVMNAHVHDGIWFNPGVGQGVFVTSSSYLAHDETVALPSSGIVVKNTDHEVTVNICLNGHTLDLNGTQIWIDEHDTLNIYDCSGGKGKIIGGEGKKHGTSTALKGGAVYVRGSTLNIYGGTIEGNQADWGGAIFIDGSDGVGSCTVNMYGGTIQGNTATYGGGGIEVENADSHFNMYGGSIINNTVTELNSNVHKGGGVHFASGTMTIDGTVNITGNTVAGVGNNVYVRNGKTITIGSIGEGSRIGVSAYNVENSGLDTVITSQYGSNVSDSNIKYIFMDRLHDCTVYALVHNGTELQIQKHSHNWEYGKENNWIYAYCTNTAQNCAFKQVDASQSSHDNVLTLTLSAENMVYNGRPYAGAAFANEEEITWEYAGLTVPKFIFEGTNGTVYGPSTTAPTDAGSYTVSVALAGHEDISVEQSFTISPKDVEAIVTAADRTYDGTTAAELTVDAPTGIEGETLSVTGLTAAFADKNAGEAKTVNIDSTNAVVTGGAGTKPTNYSITYPATTTANISPVEITVKAADAEKYVGDPDPEFTYTITSGNLVEGETLSGISYSRAEGETVGEYVITATEAPGSNPNYSLTLQAGKLVISQHIWDAGTVTKQPTCTEKGSIKYICTECGVEREEDIDALGHTVVTDDAVPATCTTEGLTEGSHCSVCGEVLVAQQTIDALGHDWGEWKVVKEATETEEGKEERECARCGEKEEKTLPVLGHTHTVVTDAAVAATCTTTGLTEGSHCSECKEVLVAQKTIEALGHDWSGEWKVVKEATATEDGKRETYCTRGCGQKKVEVIPAIGSADAGDTAGGDLQKDAEVAKDAPINEATLDNKKSELLNAANIFSAEEKTAIENGRDARVWLEVTRTDENNIPVADKEEVKKAAELIMGDNPDITYFDADLFKQVEGSAKTQLHEPGIDIKVTIMIPEELLNHDRTMVREYKIIRLHYDVATGESKVEVLGGSFDAATGEFTFATDKFSTYAIAYSDVPAVNNDIIHVTGITLSQGSAVLTNAGETLQLTATVAPENATDKGVSWMSSDTNVATVDANGKVTAVGNGTCAIIVTTYDGYFSVSCTITVNIQSGNGGNNGAGQIISPSTGGECGSGRMIPIAVFMMLAFAGVAATAYVCRKRTVR